MRGGDSLHIVAGVGLDVVVGVCDIELVECEQLYEARVTRYVES